MFSNFLIISVIIIIALFRTGSSEAAHARPRSLTSTFCVRVPTPREFSGLRNQPTRKSLDGVLLPAWLLGCLCNVLKVFVDDYRQRRSRSAR